MDRVAPLQPERTALTALQYDPIVIFVRKRSHGTSRRNTLRLCRRPLLPFSPLIECDGQVFCGIAVFARVLLLDQRKNCPFDAPQATAHDVAPPRRSASSASSVSRYPNCL